jgi:hypothetical protein
MALDKGVVDAVANANLKNLGEAGAYYAMLAMGDGVAHQRRVHVQTEPIMTMSVKSLLELDPLEAVRVVKGMSGNDLAQTLAQLGSAIAQIQQFVKGAQTTPPVTAKP